jgi:hypothetical protein
MFPSAPQTELAHWSPGHGELSAGQFWSVSVDGLLRSQGVVLSCGLGSLLCHLRSSPIPVLPALVCFTFTSFLFSIHCAPLRAPLGEIPRVRTPGVSHSPPLDSGLLRGAVQGLLTAWNICLCQPKPGLSVFTKVIFDHQSP